MQIIQKMNALLSWFTSLSVTWTKTKLNRKEWMNELRHYYLQTKQNNSEIIAATIHLLHNGKKKILCIIQVRNERKVTTYYWTTTNNHYIWTSVYLVSTWQQRSEKNQARMLTRKMKTKTKTWCHVMAMRKERISITSACSQWTCVYPKWSNCLHT